MLSPLLLLAPLHAQQPADEEPPPLTQMPELLEYIQAPYPPEAEAAGIEGTVKLLLEIDEAGEVTTVELLESAGHGFDEAATDAAWQFLFTPAEDANGPTGVAIEFDYSFVLQAAPEEVVEAVGDLPVNLEGTVVEKGTRRDLADIAVQVTDAAETLLGETTTDRQGRYQFRGVPVGDVRVRAFYPGYQDVTEEVEVTEGEVTDLRVWIKNLSYRDDEVVGVYRKESTDVTRRVLSVEEIRRIPGTFGDPVRVIQTLPGAARSPLGTGALIIRGANPEDSAVYVDGIRIPLIYHLGGYVSILNADLIDSVSYLPGNYGVQYGRSTGGVVDVTTKSEYPEQPKLSWSTDLLDTGVLVQGRAGKDGRLGYAAAGRRSYIDAVLASVPNLLPNPDLVVRPRWYDYQLKLTRLEDGSEELSFFLFGFQDQLIFSSPEDFAQGTDPATQGDLGTSYSTHRAYVLWDHRLSPTWRLRLTPSLGIDSTQLSVGNSTNLEQVQPLAEVRAEAIWTPSEALTVTNGFDFIGGGYRFSAELPINPDQLDDYDPLGEREPFSIDGRGLGGGPDLYVRADVRPLVERDRLLLSGGVRYNFVAINDFDNPDPLFRGAALDPRVTA
ncbi:MAG: TonB family protein, partial [Myxococcota bacterium]